MILQDLLPIGIHADVPEAVYHRDPSESISASASVLKLLYNRSPRHAWAAHPKLNPEWADTPSTEAQNHGTILHALVLGTEAPHVVVPYASYTKKEAQAYRDAVLESGKIPIVQPKYDALGTAAGAIIRQLEDTLPDIWEAMIHEDTLTEATLIYRDGGTLMRSRVDFLPPPSFGFIGDLKFTGLSAEPGTWANTLRRDYLMQGSLYPRGVKELRGDRVDMRWIVAEIEPPYGVSVHALGPDLIEIGTRQLSVARSRWDACLRSNRWPSYPSMLHYARAPGWFISQDDDRATADALIDEDQEAR